MDNLQSYLQSGPIGNDVPDKKVWQNITASLQLKEEKKEPATSPLIFTIFKYAVAACVIGLAGVGVWFLSHQPQTQFANTNNTNTNIQPDSEMAVVNTPDTPFAILHNPANNTVETAIKENDNTKPAVHHLVAQANAAPPAYYLQVRNVDSQFSRIIKLQKNLISNTPVYTESPEYFKEFTTSYRQMEADEKQVKKDIVTNGFTDDLLEQLININQQKLNLLKLLQSEINKTNIRFKQNRNQIDTLKVYYITM